MPRRSIAALLWGMGLAGCAHDTVLPDIELPAVCGDGVVETGEECDTVSPGCVGCQIVPDWMCPGNVCSMICGDGVVGSGATCANATRDTACDMTGYWAARETNYTCDAIFHNAQTSSNWYLFQLSQTGSSYQVTAELDCGLHVTGSATVDYTQASLAAVLYENPMDGSGSYPARQGTSQATAGGCAVTMDRWYKVRAALASYLPSDFSTDPSLSSLPPLPSVSDPVNGPDNAAGATDPDMDGYLGMAFQIGGLATGVRESAQREWKQYATTDTPVAANALSLVVPGTWDEDESVLHVWQCSGCGLLTTPATPSTVPQHITLSFIGKTFGSARVGPVVTGVPRQNEQADLATCQNIQLILPHDPTAPSDACPSSGGL
jgi:hypothetical protein